MPLVTEYDHVVDNITRFCDELDNSQDLQDRLAYARAWYAHQDTDGEWHFGPSKFVGYSDMTAEQYMDGQPRDGRKTELTLHEWFTPLPKKNDPIYKDLKNRLTAFLHNYGKAPCHDIRINVAKDFCARQLGSDDADENRTIADLIIAVSRKLPRVERERVRAEI